MSFEEMPKISDPSVMRALAHPARMAIMEHLSASGADVTATECAEVVALSPSATSYHLRALAKAGMIEEAPSRGDGRERVWRAKMRGGYAIVTGRDSDQETRDAEGAVVEVMLVRGDQRLRDWFAGAHTDTEEWFNASFLTETILRVTAEELTDLANKVMSMLEPYKAANRSGPEGAPEGARKATFQIRTFPVDRESPK